jgi:multidrug efflux pump subunit AcrA (membrane-fusion protein)
MGAAARWTMALKLASVSSARRAMRLSSLSSPKKLDQVTPFVPWPLESDKVGVSTDVAGIVRDLDVSENQHVETGQVLYRLDDLP